MTVSSGGCTATSTATSATVNPAPKITISGIMSVCSGSSTTLTAGGSSSYSWSVGPTTATYTVSPVSNTTYTVTGTLNGCTSSASQMVTVKALPQIPVITEKASMLSSTAASSYQWYLDGSEISGASSQSYTPTVTGTYSVKITGTNGCSASSADFHIIFFGVNEQSKENLIQIAPNPSEGLFYIDIKDDDFVSLWITDGRGAMVLAIESYSNQIDLTKQSPGMYFCNVLTSKGLAIRKLVINASSD